jgi:uncharacterized protein YciI
MQNLFALVHSRGPGWNDAVSIEEQPDWNAHAKFMDQLVDEGFILLAGPLEGSVDVLLILRATSIEEIERRLSNDPWRRSGLLVAKQCWPWRLRLGTLA